MNHKTMLGFALMAAMSVGANAFADNAKVSSSTGATVNEYGDSIVYVFADPAAADAKLVIETAGKADILIVGGGGAGGNVIGGGGGGGQVIILKDVDLEAGEYPVVVGAGGLPSEGKEGFSRGVRGGNGGTTTFAGYTAIGGGGGASYNLATGLDGANGGGGANNGPGGSSTLTEGGYAGGGTVNYAAGGGGGASGAGETGKWNQETSGDGGPGIYCDFATGFPVCYGAGGGGGAGDNVLYYGKGGGETAGRGGYCNGQDHEEKSGVAGTAGSGSGGGGGGWGCDENNDGGGAGGCGCVVVRICSDTPNPAPSGKFVSVTPGTYDTITVDYALLGFGAGCEECDVFVRYGTDPENLDQMTEAIDTADERGKVYSVEVGGFTPNTIYTCELVFDNGDYQSVSERFNFGIRWRDPSDLPIIAYWPFGDYNADDYSENGYNLRYNEHIDFDNDDNCAILDGAQDLFCTDGNLDLSEVENMTVECWIKVDSATCFGNSYFMMPFEYSWDCNGAISGFYFDYNEAGAFPLLTWRTDNGYFQRCPSAAIPFADNEWHHFAAVFTPKNTDPTKALRIFVDKVEYFGTAGAGEAAPSGNYAWQNYQLFIGSRANSSFKMRGSIDDIRITAAALEPDEFVERSENAFPGAASPEPKISSMTVTAIDEISSEFTYHVSTIGNGATTLGVRADYSHDGYTHAVDVASDITGKGDYKFSLADLAPDTEYTVILSATNDISDIVAAVTNVFRTAGENYPNSVNMKDGFIQGSVGSEWSDYFDIGSNINLYYTDGAWAAHIGNMGISLPAGNWVQTRPSDGATSYGSWPSYTTFGYEANINLTKGTTYYFMGSFDDNISFWIDDNRVCSAGNYAGGNGVGSFTPTHTGWHRIRIYVGNGFGGYGPINNGVGWSTNNVDWLTFANQPDEDPIFYQLDKAAAVVTERFIADSVATYVVQFNPAAAGKTAKVYAAGSYAGADPSLWGEPVAEGVIDETGLVTISFTAVDGAKYYKFAAGDEDYTWSSSAVLAEEAVAVDTSLPAADFTSVTGTGVGTADIALNVLSPGTGASSVDIVVSYGYSPDDLEFSRTFTGYAVGAYTLVLDELDPGADYYASFHAVNGSGIESEETEIFAFTTAKVALNIAATPDHEGFSMPGLWQVDNIGSLVADWKIHPSRVLTLGSCAADSKYSPGVGLIDYWSVTDLEGRTSERTWISSDYFIYVGYVYLEDTTYSFTGSVDDGCSIAIDGVSVLGVSNYVPAKGAGWYPITLTCWDNGGAAGPNYYTFGIGWTIDGVNWNRFLDPGDGSLLRTYPGVRDGRVVSHAVADKTLSASLAFGTWQSTKTVSLHLAYGAAYGGEDCDDWEKTTLLAEGITADVLTYDANDLLAGEAGNVYHYAKFYTVDETGLWQWCGETIVLPDGSKPLLSDALIVSGEKGDTLDITGSVLAAGSGDTATLSVYVSENEDMSEPVIWNIDEEYADGDSITLALHGDDPAGEYYIKPDTTYFVRLRLVDGAGHKTVSPLFEVTTMGEAICNESSIWVDDVNPIAYFGGTLAKVGARHETTVTLFTGPSADNLTNTQSTVITADATAFQFVIDYGKVDFTVYFKFVISNDCDTAVWVRESQVYSRYIRDQYVYNWNPEVAEGVWENPDNWIVQGSPVAATYPHTSEAAAVFDSCDPEKTYEISLSSYFMVNALYFRTPGLKIHFTGTGWQDGSLDWNSSTSTPKSGIYQSNWWQGMSTDIELVFKNMYYGTTGFVYTNADRTRILLDGAYVQARSDTNLNATDNVLELTNGSVYRVDYANMYLNGTNPKIVVDNSKVWFTSAGGIGLSGAGSTEFVISGADAEVHVSENCFFANGTDKPTVRFIIPAGGFTNPAVVCWNSVFGGRSGSGPIDIVVDKASPAKKGGRKFETTLVTSAYGIAPDIFTFVAPDFAEIYTDDLVNEVPTTIKAFVKSSGFSVFVR